MKRIFHIIFCAAIVFFCGTHSCDASDIVDIIDGVTLGLTGTNGSRVESSFKADKLIEYTLTGPATNVVYFRRLPEGNFEFHLYDNKGREMQKTALGISLTKMPSNPTKDDLLFWEKSHFTPLVLGEGLQFHGVLFRPEDVFVIPNDGVYELSVRVRLCAIKTNGVADRKAMTNGLNWTQAGVQRVKDFGILTSPELRCKVIKSR